MFLVGKISEERERQIKCSNLAFRLNVMIKTKKGLYIWEGEGGRGEGRGGGIMITS